jgi:hypothetical protein
MNWILLVWPLLAVWVGLIGCHSAWAAILLYHAGVVVGLMIRPAALQKLRTGFDLRWAGSAIPLGIVAFFAVRLMLPSLLGLEPEELWRGMPSRLSTMGLSGISLAAFAVYLVTIHPVIEDLAWCGLLADGTTSRGFRFHGFWFAIYHLPVLLFIFPGAWLLAGISFVVLLSASMLWRHIAGRTGGLQSVILQHAAADAGIMAAAVGLNWSNG